MRYEDRNTVYGINKARLIKRVAAACLDFIIFTLVAVGFATLSSLMFNYDSYREQLDQKYEQYGVYLEYDASVPEEERVDGAFCEIKEEGDACYVAWEAFYADEEAEELLHKCSSITIITISIGLLGGSLFAYFLLPLLLKNGQTFGKKFMRIALVSNEGIRVPKINLFIRALFGIYVVELMVPLYGIIYIFSGLPGSIVATAVVLGIVLANMFLIMTNPLGTAIHDLIGKTVVVEFDGQAIFDTVEELQEFKEREKQKNLEYAKKKSY